MKRPALVAALTVGLLVTTTSQAWAAFAFDRYAGTGTLDVADVQGFYGWTKAETRANAAGVAIEAALGRTAVRSCDGAQDSYSQYDYLTVTSVLQKVKGKQVYALQGYPAGGWFPSIPACPAGQTETVAYQSAQAFRVWTNVDEICHSLYALDDPSVTYGEQLPACPKPPATLPG